MRGLRRFVLGTAAVAAAVAGLAWLLGGAPALAPALAGAGLAALAQLGMGWLLAVRLFPGQLLWVYGLGMLGRMVLLGLAVFVLVPATDLAPLPFSLSLVAVLAVTTALAPLLLAAPRGRAAPVAAPDQLMPR